MGNVWQLVLIGLVICLVVATYRTSPRYRRRWVLVVVLAALPVWSLILVLDWIAADPPAATATNTPACVAAAEIAQHDTDAAVTALEKIRDTAPKVGGDAAAKLAEKDAQAERICAAAKIEELTGSSIEARATGAAEAQVDRLSRFVLDRPLGLGSPPEPAAVAAVLLANLVLATMAIRQVMLWRSERTPGPVLVEPVKGGDEGTEVVLAAQISERLARTGVFPPGGTVGEVGAVVVDAVEVAGDTNKGNWVVALASLVSRLFQLKRGSSVAVALRSDTAGGATSDAKVAVVRLADVRTDQTIAFKEMHCSDMNQMVDHVAYWVYLQLLGQPEVRRRLPQWLSWTSLAALRDYQIAADRRAEGDYLGAIRLLTGAARKEPANSLIPMLLADCHAWVARGRPDENELRPVKPDRKVRDRQHLLAVISLLRAVGRGPDSREARIGLAVELSYAKRWIDAVGRVDPDLRNEFVELVQLVEHLPLGGHGQLGRTLDEATTTATSLRAFAAVAGDDTGTDEVMAARAAARATAVHQLRSLAIRQAHEARHAVRGTVRLRLWWKLSTRREADGLLLGAIRRRTVRVSIDAIDVATEWTQFDTLPSATELRRLVRRTGRVVRASRRTRRSVGTSTMAYNVASMSACEYRVLKKFTPGNRPAIESVARSSTYDLTLALGSPESRLAEEMFDYLPVDSDFDWMREDPRFSAFGRRFEVETAQERTNRVFAELADTVRSASSRVNEASIERLTKLSTQSPEARPTRAEVVSWFRQDARAWQLLGAWLDAPAVQDARRSFLDHVAQMRPVVAGTTPEPEPFAAQPVNVDELRVLIGPGEDAALAAANSLALDTQRWTDDNFRAEARDLMAAAHERWAQLERRAGQELMTVAEQSTALDSSDG